ncbi:FecR family protein [Thiothrix lacustris]|uniref:FecR family protein n=1 Tax=Thiothrix lacustris TaxID=525917 RepID=UPI0027E5BE16|nr:FecR domain-containing protein [Thiothrix lacustris]WMP16275.1 FecR domain-containing protein [Thiothrix lacustris]
MKLIQIIVFVSLMLFGGMVVALPETGEQPVGKVIFSTGNSTLQTESGEPIKGLAETFVYVGQTLSTAAGSHMHVQMMDGALLLLRPESSIRIAYYTVDLIHPVNTKILLDMKKGVIRSVTGKGGQGNKQGFRFNTPVAAIGIKGTDFTVLATPDFSSIVLRQGGVLVSPFSDGCLRYAVGACSGGNVVLLTAADQQMLAEVRAAKAVRIPKINAQVVPDNVAPAHPLEEKNIQDSKIAPVTSLINTSNGNVIAPVVASATTSAQQPTVNGSSTSNTAVNTSQGASTQASATTPSVGSATTSGTTEKKITSVAPVVNGTTVVVESASTLPSVTATNTVNNSATTANTVVTSEANTSSSSSKNTVVASGSKAEVASLAPINAEVGPKESVTSELSSQIVSEKTLSNTVEAVLTPAVVMQTKSQPFYWGRWAGYTENLEQVIVRDPVVSTQVVASNDVYVLGDSEAGVPKLPQSGKITFNLDKSEAVVLDGKSIVPASVSAASLEADFDSSRFKTDLTVSSAGLKDGSVDLQAQGDLSLATGSFVSNPLESTMNVSGEFSNNAEYAGYEFNDPDNNISGVTSWQQ